MTTAVRRIAQLWTPRGIVDSPVDGDWPAGIVHGEWVYEPWLDARGSVLVLVGRRTGAEFGRYGTRRAVTCDDAMNVLQSHEPLQELNDDRRSDAGATRQSRNGERRDAEPAVGGGRRRHFGKQPARAPIRAGRSHR